MEYYCAAVTDRGFYDGFLEVFNEKSLKRLYVIKGASGVGKSTLMRKIADEGTRRGMKVDRVFCSNDPRSLDGVIVGNIGVIDGTPPHTYEPKMAGAFEKLVDLGQFWDVNKLKAHRTELFELSKRKQTAFSKIYELTSVYGRMDDLIDEEWRVFYLRGKIRDYVRSLVRRNLASGNKGEAKMRIFSATFGGNVELPHKKQYSIDNTSGFAPLFFEELIAELKRNNLECFCSPALPSMRRTDTVYLPSLGIVYTSHRGGRAINGSRFMTCAPSKKTQSELKQLESIKTSIKDAIFRERENAVACHDEIERIYIGAMDFDKLNEYTNGLIKEIFSSFEE